MNLNPFKMISPAFQKQLVGGLVGSLTYWADRAIADTQTGYPPELKQQLAPQLPRNDEIITSIVPPVIMYVAYKKNPSKFRDLAKGTILYSGPHLMKLTAVNTASTLAPTASAPLRLIPAPINQTSRYPQPIPVQVATPAPAVGKYR